jgi:BirA family biotin operon repressor/biotin-[acetyl-CoA-carboxylase] ligase
LERGVTDPAALLTAFLRRMRVRAAELATARAELLQAYTQACDTIGRRVRASIVDGKDLTGRAVAVGPAGELVLEDGTAITTGEVEHLRGA